MAYDQGGIAVYMSDASNAACGRSIRAEDISLALNEEKSRWIRVERDRKSVPN